MATIMATKPRKRKAGRPACPPDLKRDWTVKLENRYRPLVEALVLETGESAATLIGRWVREGLERAKRRKAVTA